MATESNVTNAFPSRLLDEPTNDLDLRSRDTLEASMMEFPRSLRVLAVGLVAGAALFQLGLRVRGLSGIFWEELIDEGIVGPISWALDAAEEAKRTRRHADSTLPDIELRLAPGSATPRGKAVSLMFRNPTAEAWRFEVCAYRALAAHFDALVTADGHRAGRVVASSAEPQDDHPHEVIVVEPGAWQNLEMNVALLLGSGPGEYRLSLLLGHPGHAKARGGVTLHVAR